MDHVIIDPHGYWAHTGEAELIARLAVAGERTRWQLVLARHLPPETCRLISQEVLEAHRHESARNTIDGGSHHEDE